MSETQEERERKYEGKRKRLIFLMLHRAKRKSFKAVKRAPCGRTGAREQGKETAAVPLGRKRRSWDSL